MLDQLLEVCGDGLSCNHGAVVVFSKPRKLRQPAQLTAKLGQGEPQADQGVTANLLAVAGGVGPSWRHGENTWQAIAHLPHVSPLCSPEDECAAADPLVHLGEHRVEPLQHLVDLFLRDHGRGLEAQRLGVVQGAADQHAASEQARRDGVA